MPCSATRPERATPASPALARPRRDRLQALRRSTQVAFFAFFLVAPALDLLRLDLTRGEFWILGQRATLGLQAFARGEIDATQAALNLLGRGLLPALVVVVGFLWVASRLGRVYCGWLCPHFSLVETLNDLLHRASGRLSLWDAAPTPLGNRRPRRAWWPVFVLACAAFGLLWALTLLSYLWPPSQVWGGAWLGDWTRFEMRFVAAATTVFTAELLFARHLFCRFGCAVGLFQSLVWMAHPKALVMAFDRTRAADCRSCQTPRTPAGPACEAVCPMRLQPRRVKRLMFSCVQCGRCRQECATSQARHDAPASLEWTVGVDALRETLRQRREGQEAAQP